MPVRDEVRDAQRTLAALDAAHTRASTRLDQARARRVEVLAEADLAVAAAQEGVEAAVAQMAAGVGVELTSQMLGVETTEVRRIAKAAQASPAGSDASGSKAHR